MTAIATTGPTTLPAPPAVRDDEPLFEIINGQRVELPPMSAFETNLAFNLAFYIEQFARPRRLGRAVTEILFLLNANLDLRRRPDGAYVSFTRWPRKKKIPRQEAWEVVPELAIEVVS